MTDPGAPDPSAPVPAAPPAPPDRLVREWVLCAIAAAAARFVPVPLVDDTVRERATQMAVVRTLRVHGRAYPSEAVEPLWLGVGGSRAGLASALRSVPRRVLLFPVRKYVAVFGAVRGVPNDVLAVLLLGRSVHRALAAGRLDLGGRDRLRRDAQDVRRAYDAAVAGMDLQMVTGALSDALSRGRPMTRAAIRYARRYLRPGERTRLPDDPRHGVGEGAARVEEALGRPEVRRRLEEFDTRFDAELARRPGGPSGRP